MRLLHLTAIVPLALAAAMPAQGAKTGADDPFARYKETIQRVPFRHHTEGRERIAETRSIDALRILIGDYTKPQAYPEHARYTIASLIGKYFSSPEALDPLAALRASHDKPVDAWLWFNTLRILADHDGEQAVLTIAQSDKSIRNRAAAIAAIGESHLGNVKAAICPACLDFPKKESERNLLIGAMSGALWAQKKKVNSPEYRDALKAYIGLLAPDLGLSAVAKVQIGRHLQWLLNGPTLWMNPEPWLELLARGDVKTGSSGGSHQTVTAPRFFGIETDGDRICYVIDMSDSMLREIAPSARPQQGAITGPRPKKKRALLDESDLPWEVIKTRWDLAREQLKISLLRTPADKYFSVVWFGDQHGTLEATKGMVKASKANIDRAVAELEAIKPEPLPPGRAGGFVIPGEKERKILRGDTNLHGGMRHAFGLHGKGYADQAAYVDDDTLTEGCDTIFLLSDGAPTNDDFVIDDKDYHEGDVVADIETGTPAARTPRINYPGPYREDDWLLDDVRRMNAFRRIRIHCVGLGEANMGLLRRIAEIGHGETFEFGRKKAGEPAHGGGDMPKR